MQIKIPFKFYLIQVEMTIKRTNDPYILTGDNVSWWHHYGNRYRYFSKKKQRKIVQFKLYYYWVHPKDSKQKYLKHLCLMLHYSEQLRNRTSLDIHQQISGSRKCVNIRNGISFSHK